MTTKQLLTNTQIVPFPHQLECLDILEFSEKKGKKEALVVLATGLGKTILSALHAGRRQAWSSKPEIKCLFLSHQTDGLEQAQQEFEVVFGNTASYGVLHGGNKDYHKVNFLFASFQTMRKSLTKFDPNEFSLLIVDETHHVYAETYIPVIDYFQPDFLLGITATPDRTDEQDINDIYGEPVYVLPLVDALARGLLTPIDYRLMTDEIMFKGAKFDTPHGKMSMSALNRKLFVPKRDEEIAELIIKAMGETENPRVLIFCSAVEHSEKMAALLPSSVPLHSKVSPGEKRVRLGLFKQGVFKVATTVDMFNESLNVPEANIIVFLRSTSSPTVYFQQLGRGLRKHKSKQKVLVLDFAGNCDRITTVFELWKEVKEKSDKYRRRGRRRSGYIPPFSLDVDKVEFEETIVPLVDLIQKFKSAIAMPYETYKEASDAAQQLEIKSVTDYQLNYKKDIRLHSNTHLFYKDKGWTDWYAFLNIGPYETYKEASDVARKLGIIDSRDYKARYKEDFKLPSRPELYYEDWISWDVFLGKFYETYEEASEAVKRLAFKRQEDYVANYKKDAKLPRNPNRYYKDKGWINWGTFLGTVPYETYKEASDAATKLGIKDWREYKVRYKEDPRLLSSPEQLYKDKGWVNMATFLNQNVV